MKSIYNHRGKHNRTDFTDITFNIMSKNVHELEASVYQRDPVALQCHQERSALLSESGRVPGRTPSHEVLLPNSFNAQAQDTTQFPSEACTQHPMTERTQLLKTAKTWVGGGGAGITRTQLTS